MFFKQLFIYFSQLYDFRYVLQQMVMQQLTLRYRRTILGYLWTLFNPLLMMSVTALVFSTIFKMDLKTYAIFLFSGMIPFMCFSSVVTQSGQSLIMNEGLIKKIYIPKVLFPLSISLSLLIDSILTAIALFLIILVIGGKLTLALTFVPAAFFLLFIFSFGISMVMSVCTVYFRDLQYVVGILMQALLYLTPVFYKPESLQGKVAWLISLNPLTNFVELFRSPIYIGVFPAWSTVHQATIFALLSLILGFWFFYKHEYRVAFRL